ncbi:MULTISPECIES: helix-turn-helix domain-containing protein [Streptococcus]|uniref:helix-turn-helix domain-containing protein n=1 Tax=Streptococcus TaxID=1301 RepID=UPI0011D0E162|nr:MULTISPECIES: helix-turn-helix transcriptional regulator [Streptococcus]
MTRRKEPQRNLMKIGNIIRNHRLNLLLDNGREGFLSDRLEKGILNDNSISLESLKNIENGYTMPSLPTLKLLAIALEVDFFKLVEEIYDLIY